MENRIWWNRSDEADEDLNWRLSQHLIVRLSQFDKEFDLTTNASQEDIGDVLCQRCNGGVKLPMVCISRKLIPAETSNSTIEWECLALMWAVQQLDLFLYVNTNHQQLFSLSRSRINNDCIIRSPALQTSRYRVCVIKVNDRASRWIQLVHER